MGVDIWNPEGLSIPPRILEKHGIAMLFKAAPGQVSFYLATFVTELGFSQSRKAGRAVIRPRPFLAFSLHCGERLT